MAIVNVVDRRERKYRFLVVNAIVEAAWHDNTVRDADIAPRGGDGGPAYEEKEGCTVGEAVMWAQNFRQGVTLYLYDEGGGTTVSVRRAVG